MQKIVYIALLIGLFSLEARAQYPQYFLYDNENGLPSNEVYCMVQDQKGFLWIGCDAGLYKFDGVRYTAFKSKTQNSKSISNLTLSPDNRLYCANFQDQIFYLENNVLFELKQDLHKIANLAIDQNGILYVNHNDGVSTFNPKTNTWQKLNQTEGFTRSIQVNSQKQLSFLTPNGVAKISGSTVNTQSLPETPGSISAYFLLACHRDMEVVLKRDESIFYFIQNNRITKNASTSLGQALQDRKVTNIKSMSDGKLWICTYTGLICYDVETDTTTFYYPELSFSDILIDKEGNYWLTTLQAGLLRVPNLNYAVWNISNPEIASDKISHITTDGTNIFFSSINGAIGKLNATSGNVKTFSTNKNADIECLLFDKIDQRLLFNLQNKSYTLQNDLVLPLTFKTNSIKSIIHLDDQFFFATSSGLYVEYDQTREQLSNVWTRQLDWDPMSQTLFAATNKGLHIFSRHNSSWTCTDTLYVNTQIVSIDAVSNNLYALTFDGKLFCNGTLTAQLPDYVQGHKIMHLDQSVYVASNKGVWIFDLNRKEWLQLNHLAGIASENVQDLLILDNNLWLATGSGLQKIPLHNNPTYALAKIYLIDQFDFIELDYAQSLIIHPEASIYSSNGQFEYAYRINQGEWIRLPSRIDQINIQHMPSGAFEVEVKVIDHLGRDSENVILIKGYAHPPYWKRWWFIALVAMLALTLIVYFTKRRIQKLKKEQQLEIDRLNLENELRLTQQSALKAQMNPHFIFNVLNSIKGYIYENDKKNAAHYLSRFSDLIRKILDQSSAPHIKLSEEIETLQLYIQLEAILLDDNFIYTITADETTHDIYLPALMIQPWVENAFKHGLRHKHGPKQLDITFSFNNDTLTVRIQDNGIGRTAAERINQNKTHDSFASAALTQRIVLLNAEHPDTVGIEILDLQDELGNASGTLVILNIKIEA